VYDWETGFYYLQSRYYDPTTGRFISADVLLSTGQGVLGHNCYAYCGDNPVSRVDYNGACWEDFLEWLKSLFGGGNRCGGKEVTNSTSFYNPDGRGDIDFQYENDTLSITVYAEYSGDGSYFDLVKEGIEEYWNGTYVLDDGSSLTINITVIEGVSPKGGSLKYILHTQYGRSGGTELYPGLYEECSGEKYIKWVSAHELGHQIGLHDAYKNNADGTCTFADYVSMMNRTYQPVTSRDVERVFRYYKTGEMQHYD
jgi:RHS repeat-associated protein